LFSNGTAITQGAVNCVAISGEGYNEPAKYLYFVRLPTLGLTLPPGSIIAQQGTLRQQLVGTWTIVSYETALADGTRQQLANPKGILMFDVGGRYASVIGRADRPKFKSASSRRGGACCRKGGPLRWHNAHEADKTLTQQFHPLYVPIMRGRISKAPSPSSGMN
jgi:hypothetical protein